MLTEKCTFPKGAIIITGGDGEKEVTRIYRDFVLEEERMEQTFQVMNDEDLDGARLSKETAYYSAALMAARIRIPGVEKTTPEMVLDLHPDDGRYLLMKSAELEKRRDDFRSEIEAASQGHTGA